MTASACVLIGGCQEPVNGLSVLQEQGSTVMLTMSKENARDSFDILTRLFVVLVRRFLLALPSLLQRCPTSIVLPLLAAHC